MSEGLRILVTGFGPFPGAPFNPTMPLVKRLTQLRRPALDDVALTGHIFHVTYQTVDRELPGLIAQFRPQALLMFGLANRTAHLRIETRARNAVTTHLPDADGNRAQKTSIVHGADAKPFGPHTANLLHAACATGIDARRFARCRSLSLQLSELARDRGDATAWRAGAGVVRPRSPDCARRLRTRGSIRHHAGTTGRCRRSHAAGTGQAGTASDRAERSASLTLP